MSRQGAYKKPNNKNILSFWEHEAEDIGESPLVTIRDHCFRIHEIHLLVALIPSCESLLDIGCGTGFSTFVFSKKSNFTLGIDYSEKMIKWANQLKQNKNYRLELSSSMCPFWDLPLTNINQIEFQQGDLLNPSLKLSGSPFDVVCGQRILINLPSHSKQMEGLKNIRSQVRKGSLLILVEATQQGHSRTDEYRSLFGLSKLEKYWHNVYVDENRFNEWENVGWRVENIMGFDSYMLLSKVIYPASVGESECEFLSGANAAAMELASVFRTKSAVESIGVDSFLLMYVNRVKMYDQKVGERIDRWLKNYKNQLGDWENLGHQRLIIAYAC